MAAKSKSKKPAPPKNVTAPAPAGGKGNCICQEDFPGQWYCYTWDGGALVQCPGQGPFDSEAACKAARCEG